MMRLIFTFAVFLWVLRLNRKNAKQRIEQLHESIQSQIAELEAQANEIQKRFGMELHDDIAGQLVSLVNHIELQLIRENDHRVRDKLSKISDMARQAYISTRSKSHEWYLRGTEGEKTIFSERVRQIVGSALMDGSYEKQIEIDDSCLEGVPFNTRIQLLRIIQEVMANIVKHARAQRVKVMIYQDEGTLVLQIADNGRGFDVGNSESQKGLGLASLRDRISELTGSMEISSSQQGTEFLFTIPSR